MLNPGNGVIWNAADFARARQFPECGFQTEVKELAHAQRHSMAIHAIAARYRTVAHATGRVQKYRCMQRAALFSSAGTPQTLQFLLLVRSKAQRLPPGGEWHKPFSHQNVLMV
jgi:hypothetical protein